MTFKVGDIVRVNDGYGVKYDNDFVVIGAAQGAVRVVIASRDGTKGNMLVSRFNRYVRNNYTRLIGQIGDNSKTMVISQDFLDKVPDYGGRRMRTFESFEKELEVGDLVRHKHGETTVVYIHNKTILLDARKWGVGVGNMNSIVFENLWSEIQREILEDFPDYRPDDRVYLTSKKFVDPVMGRVEKMYGRRRRGR